MNARRMTTAALISLAMTGAAFAQSQTGAGGGTLSASGSVNAGSQTGSTAARAANMPNNSGRGAAGAGMASGSPGAALGARGGQISGQVASGANVGINSGADRRYTGRSGNWQRHDGSWRAGRRSYGGPVIGFGIAPSYYGDAYYGDSYAYYGTPYQSSGSTYYSEPSGDDVNYCIQRFKSYDPASGTYLGYDGMRHPCP